MSFKTSKSNFEIPPNAEKHQSGIFSEKNVLFLTFLMIGCLQLGGWNALICFLTPLETFAEFQKLPVVLRWTYGVILFVGNALLFKYSFVNKPSLYCGIASVPLSLGLFAIVFTWFPSASMALCPIITVMLTCGSVLIGSAGFGYAAQLPQDQSGIMSSGLGFSGIVIYIIWTLSHSVFTINKPIDLAVPLWIFFVVISILTAVCYFLIVKAFNGEQLSAVEAGTKISADAADTEASISGVEDDFVNGGYKCILSKAWIMGIPTFQALFITLIIFPIIGPVEWSKHKIISNIDLLIGIFLVGDLIGRFLPNFVNGLMVDQKNVHIISNARLIFIITFFLPLINNFPQIFKKPFFAYLNMFLMALTSGWMSTCSIVRTIETVKGDEAKKKISTYCLCCVALSILLSQGLSIPLSSAISNLVLA